MKESGSVYVRVHVKKVCAHPAQVCVCVRVCAREKERENASEKDFENPMKRKGRRGTVFVRKEISRPKLNAQDCVRSTVCV